ncbi:hypothetical protein OOJ91_03845 [Micromonospora lupini]|uniref:hypothetical protein n=1 Tax=Micromonospora lupini TaxID=285679 RepID=UPI002257E886|nr:hypothetical protein [Micromonospora lupini]MCX5065008.1 hypothetical protein [Micromonospora lupini]
MFISGSRATTWGVVAAVVVAAGPSAAWAQQPETRPAAGLSALAGMGHFVYDEPNVVGHRIWFGVSAVSTPDGTARGQFLYRHEWPDGTLVAQGRADVTCLKVTGNVAVFTAIVPVGEGTAQNHGFYVKIIDGGPEPDVIVDAQAQNGATRPPTRCIDPETEVPADVPPRPRYPILAGGYLVRSAGPSRAVAGHQAGS